MTLSFYTSYLVLDMFASRRYTLWKIPLNEMMHLKYRLYKNRAKVQAYHADSVVFISRRFIEESLMNCKELTFAGVKYPHTNGLDQIIICLL